MSGEPATGVWARKMCPPGAWTVFDLAEELGITYRHVKANCSKWGIGQVRRYRVKLADGSFTTRYLRVLTPADVNRYKERTIYGPMHKHFTHGPMYKGGKRQ